MLKKHLLTIYIERSIFEWEKWDDDLKRFIKLKYKYSINNDHFYFVKYIYTLNKILDKIS